MIILLLLLLVLLQLLLLLPFSSCLAQHSLQLSSLCEGGGGKVALGPTPALLTFTGTSGLGTCHLQVNPNSPAINNLGKKHLS